MVAAPQKFWSRGMIPAIAAALLVAASGCGERGQSAESVAGLKREAARAEAEKMLAEKRKAEAKRAAERNQAETEAAAREAAARQKAKRAELERLQAARAEEARQQQRHEARLALVGTLVPELILPTGRVYRDVTITKVSDVEVMFTHGAGVLTVPLPELPPGLQEKLQYDEEEYRAALEKSKAG